MKGCFHSHEPRTGRRWVMVQPLGPAGLAARVRFAAPEPVDAIEEEAVARDKVGRSKTEGPKVHIGFRLAADGVESVRASGPGYNVRVEEALRAAGFGAKAKGRRKQGPKRA
jgi:uncharacterized protein (DUF4415 family)